MPAPLAPPAVVVPPLAGLPGRARREAPRLRKAAARLARADSRALDAAAQAAHSEAFSQLDCLACGNCCRSASPRLTPADQDRLARALRLRPADFAARYVRRDGEGDAVFQRTPCPFLGPDNACAVYDHRPTACRDYPHTDRARFGQLLPLTLKNAEICPAAFAVLDALARALPH